MAKNIDIKFNYCITGKRKYGAVVEYYARIPENAGSIPTCAIHFSRGMARQT